MRKNLSYLQIVVVFFVVGCGFHLRTPVLWPQEYRSVYIMGGSGGSSSFSSVLQKLLPDDIKVVDSQQLADLTIQIISERQQVRTITAAALDRNTEEVVDAYVTVQVVDKQGRFIFPPRTITRSQDFVYEESDLLGRSNDFQITVRELNSELASTFMRQLDATFNSENRPK